MQRQRHSEDVNAGASFALAPAGAVRATYSIKVWKQESARLESYVKEQGMEILALEDFERFKLMKDFTHHVGAILAMVNDVLRPRSFEEFERYGFGEVSLV